MTKVKKPKGRTFKVWVGIDKSDDDDVCTWSAARTRRVCRVFLLDVYSHEEVRRDVRIVPATLTLSPKGGRRKT